MKIFSQIKSEQECEELYQNLRNALQNYRMNIAFSVKEFKFWVWQNSGIGMEEYIIARWINKKYLGKCKKTLGKYWEISRENIKELLENYRQEYKEYFHIQNQKLLTQKQREYEQTSEFKKIREKMKMRQERQERYERKFHYKQYLRSKITGKVI